MLIVNADDWGRCKTDTDKAVLCHAESRISSASAMVFMEDSARGAELAQNVGIEVGLHINLSEKFTGKTVPTNLRDAHAEVREFLCFNKYALTLYHPFRRGDFALVFRAQWDEFVRLFGRAPSHLDGHQHMHLCTNMLLGKVLPPHCSVRRSFSFVPGEKSTVNRAYRALVDRSLAKRHRLADYFFALSQNLESERLSRIVNLAKNRSVELMTHPRMPGEFQCLMGDEFARLIADVPMGNYSLI